MIKNFTSFRKFKEMKKNQKILSRLILFNLIIIFYLVINVTAYSQNSFTVEIKDDSLKSNKNETASLSTTLNNILERYNAITYKKTYKTF